MKLPLVYSSKYNTDLAELGIVKPFALDRGQLVLSKLASDMGEIPDIHSPEPISDQILRLVHTAEYLETLNNSSTWIELLELKADEYFPEKAQAPLTLLLDDIKTKCGGTLLACELALKHGLAANLGGGYHHAFPDCGRGFCALHDIACAIRSLKARKLCRKVLVVDLDFHQGDGTAVVFQGDNSVYTLSVHSEEGWPEEKQQSTLDVPIKSDETHLYLKKVEAALAKALSDFAPDLVLYVAGSDPYEKDVLPGTKFIQLTLDQMRRRDELVIDRFADLKIPLAMVFAGGYGPHVWEVHYFATRRILERAGALSPVR
jgi:acetoin utilization deacetylase AcuC-like enzyme